VHVSEMSDEFVRNPADVVSVGDEVQVKILKVEGNKISLSMKALKEPEPVDEEEAAPEEEEAVPTVMELALQQARERARQQEKRARAKAAKESHGPSPVDDIIARTLQYHREQSKKG